MEYYFINDSFKLEINQNVVNNVFPNLNGNHKNILLEYLLNVMDIISIKFNFDLSKRNIYEQQFRQNKYRDAIGLLYLLLPYIDDTSGEKRQSLRSLEDLYIKKKNNANVDINKEEPKYEYTNLQYGRCKRINNGNEIKAEELQFSEEHLTHNYLLLLDTIQTVANKLYVNWINIRPVDPYTATSTLEAFKQTNENMKSHKIIDWYPATIDANGKLSFDKQNKNNRGLNAGEIYNIISNYLFHEVKNIKWILYDVYIDDIPYKYINILNDYLDVELCAKNITWNILPEENKLNFNNQLNNLIELYLNDSQIGNLSEYNSRRLMEVLIFYFDKYGNQSQIDEYVKLKYDTDKNKDDEDEEELIINNKQTYKMTAKSLSNNGMHVYEYIRSCLFDIKFTWYGEQYLTYDKDNKEYKLNKEKKSYENPNNTRFTIKNVYNYAKSLISDKNNDGKYVTFPKNWKSLSPDDKEKIKSRLTVDSTWFNISRYLRNQAGLDKTGATLKNRNIHDHIQGNLAGILFDVLARSGVLTEFVPDPMLTDYAFLPQSTNDRNDAIQKKVGETVIKNWSLRKRWEKSIYFINKMEYGDMEMTYKSGNSVKTEKYIDAISDTSARLGSWIQFYAMDWISQIGFFHHYLNNRVIYVTGGTGVGKSTQVPKLLLYALKMIDYKINGKIACTQPRIPPTKENASRISNEMGIPINSYNKSIDKDISTNNYYIQYKYKGKSHDSKQNGLSLKIMTDGLLETQLRNPVLKTLSGNNYTSKNIYDIVIVDEAHEHNKNMDLILTRMKYASYFNNDIKLVIISATMDEDESVYRRYYRDINDNRMYPLDSMLQKYTLDRINVDRRIHISPPGEVTQYKITENYMPGKDPIEIVLQILKDTSDGDILLFEPGEAEIIEAVENINNQTSSNVIAVPYLSRMSDEKKGLVADIDKNIHKLTIPKNTRFDMDLDETIYKNNKVSEGTYKRVVIVATNIAEASITINRLRYVVDTGIQKTNIYEYKSRGENLIKMPISESSRIQRKGRVGRVAPGTVYYTYKEGDMEKNKRQFNIAIENLTDKLFEMLMEIPNDEPFFDKNNDPNNPNTIDITFDNFNKLYKYGLNTMIKDQYFTKNIFYNYEGNKMHYDYKNSTLPFIYYKTGFNKETLDDETGTFYIVHPDELCFMRNILGSIVGIIENDSCNIKQENKKFISEKMVTFWNILREYLFIVADKEKNVYKTEFGSNIIKMNQQMISLTLQQVISFIYSRKYNCSDDMLKLIAMHSTLRSINDIIYTKLIDEVDKKTGNIISKPYRQIEEILNLYGNSYGDSYALIKISNDIINFLTGNSSLTNIIANKKSPSIMTNLLMEKRKFIDGIKSNDYRNINTDVLHNFIQMYNTNKLSLDTQISSKEFDKLISNDTIIRGYLSKFKEKEYVNMIENWCNKKHLNYANVMNFFDKYLSLLNSITKYENGLIDTDQEIVREEPIKLEWFNSTTPQLINMNEVSKEDLIKIPLLHGYQYNLVRNIAIINNNYYYVGVFNPSIEYIYILDQVFYRSVDKSKSRMMNSTFIKNLGSTLLFINKKENDDGNEALNFIENIHPTIISKVLPQMLYDNKQYNTTIHEQYVRTFLNKLTINKQDNSIINNIVSKYIKTIGQIKYDLMNNYDKNAFQKLLVITNVNDEVYKKINEKEKEYEKRIENRQKIKDIMSSQSYIINTQSGGQINFNENKLNNIANPYIMDLVKILNDI